MAKLSKAASTIPCPLHVYSTPSPPSPPLVFVKRVEQEVAKLSAPLPPPTYATPLQPNLRAPAAPLLPTPFRFKEWSRRWRSCRKLSPPSHKTLAPNQDRAWVSNDKGEEGRR